MRKKIKQKRGIIFYRLNLLFRVNQARKLNMKHHTRVWIIFWLQTRANDRQVLHSWKSTLNIFGRELFAPKNFKWKEVLFHVFNSHNVFFYTHRNRLQLWRSREVYLKSHGRIKNKKFWGYARQTLILYYLCDI